MSITLQLLFILLFINCFISNLLLAEITNIPITDTSTSETVIQSALYQDNTILLRLVNEASRCSENQVKLKLIHPDGLVDTLIIENDAIIGENFCNLESEGGIIMLDGIRIYSLNPQYILLTYFCKIEQATDTEMCGQLYNWNNEIVTEQVSLGPICTNSTIVVQNLIDGDGEFLRACYLSEQRQVNLTRFTIDKNNRTINEQDGNVISDVSDVSLLSRLLLIHLFPTVGGGYGIVNYQTINRVGQVNPSPAFYVYFFPPLSQPNMDGPFQLYQPTQTNSNFRGIFKCGISYVGLGYSCIIRLDNRFVNIDFLDSGSILATNEFSLDSLGFNNIIGVESLYYGGYIILTRNTGITGSIYSNDGVFFSNWNPKLVVNGVGLTTYTEIFGVFNNNTMWVIGSSVQGLQLITDDLLVNYSSANVEAGSKSRLLNFDNPFIEWVTIGDRNYTNFNEIVSIPTTDDASSISIKFVNLIELSNGNISISQSWENNQVTLRQSFSGKQLQFVRLDNNMIVTATIFESTFNTPGASYYIKIDPGFVKDLRTGQDLIGIRKDRWTFNTETNAQDTGTGSSSALMRLTPAGTAVFAKNKDNFTNSITEELAKLIPIDSPRLSTRKHFQYDPSTKQDQVLLRVDVKDANDGDLLGRANSGRVVKDLNTLISKKDFTGISRGPYASMLDNTFGSEESPALWNKYRWVLIGILIGVGVAILILLILFILARRSGQKKGRNYMVFIFVIIIIDFGLDIAFVVLHGHDLKWLYPTSVVFLAFPILINIIVTFLIISKETTLKNREFVKWWRRNTKIALFFTLFSIIDIEGLDMIGSGYAGYDRFNAPISDESFKGILFADAVVKFLEDIPQLIIYSLYQRVTIVPAIIPILALSSCCAVIAVKSAIIIGLGVYKYPPKSYYNLRQQKTEDLKNLSKPYKQPTRTPTPSPTPSLTKPQSLSKSSTPDSAGVQTTTHGIKFTIRDPTEMESLKNIPIKSVDKRKPVTVINIGEDNGPIKERKSDSGEIGTTEGEVPTIESTQEETEDRPESTEVLETGDTDGGAIQGSSGGYKSRLIEQIDIEPESEEPPPQQQEQQEPPSPSTSSLRTFVRGFRRKDGQKGKSKDDDDKKKRDDG